MRRNLFVILCSDYREAERLFCLFLAFLDDNEPFFPKTISEHSLHIRMMDNTEYIFIDQRYASWFEGFREVFMDADEFFYGVDQYYGFENGEFLRVNEWRD